MLRSFLFGAVVMGTFVFSLSDEVTAGIFSRRSSRPIRPRDSYECKADVTCTDADGNVISGPHSLTGTGETEADAHEDLVAQAKAKCPDGHTLNNELCNIILGAKTYVRTPRRHHCCRRHH